MADLSDAARSGNDVAADPDAAPVVAPGQKSQFMSFVKTLASFTGDLSQLTCPAFLLSGVSLLEYSAHWADHPDLLADIARHADPADRMLAVTRWFISTLYGSFHSRCKTGTEKKPFNPVLGEQFYCSWPATADNPHRTTMVCEQVSHHPPVGAFYIEAAAGRVVLNGHCGQKTKFKTSSIKVEQTGRAVLTVQPPGDAKPDEYFITLPELALRGLLTAQLFVELMGKSSITSASGYQAVFEYVPKGWFGGEYHTIKGRIVKLDLPPPDSPEEPADAGTSPSSPSSDKKEKKKAKKEAKKARKLATAAVQEIVNDGEMLYELSGKWTTQTVATRVEDGAEEVLFDADAHPMVLPTVRPIDEQGELESRRLWNKVTTALNQADYQVATATKTFIEEEQRALRKARTERGETWSPKHYVFVTDSAADQPGGGSSLSLSDSASAHSAGSVKSDVSTSTRALLRSLGSMATDGAAESLMDDGLWTYIGGAPGTGGK